MPRKYVKKTKYVEPSTDALLYALKAIKIEQKSVLSVSKSHNISKTTLYNLVNRMQEELGENAAYSLAVLKRYVDSHKIGNKTVVNFFSFLNIFFFLFLYLIGLFFRRFSLRSKRMV